MQRIKSIVQLTGSLLLIYAGLLCIPMVVAWIYHEPDTTYMSFVCAIGVSLVLGLLCKWITVHHTSRLDFLTSLIMCVISWVLLSLIGGIPFMIGLNKSFIDAFFESVSGFTTTGITVLEGLDGMSPAILFWRSFIQWLGGLGILTFFLFVTSNSEGELWKLFGAESHKIVASRPVPNIYRTIKYFWAIYAVYTFLEMTILWFLGLDLYDALVHSFTTLSTGGFSNHDASIGYYQMAGYANYIWIEYTVILFMFFGGVNFLIHYRTIREDRLAFFKDRESKSYLRTILSFAAITLFGIWMVRGLELLHLEQVVRKILFQIVSIMTTTGYGTEYIGSAFFPVVTKQLFLILMVIGGCVGSTAGGIKVLRFVVLKNVLRRELDRLSLPGHAVVPVSVDKIPVKRDEILRITAIVVGWLMLIMIGSGITALFSDLGPFEAFSGMASAVGNIGPFYFDVAKMASLSWVIKLTYIIGMLAGRLELLPIFILVQRRIWR